MNVSKQCLGILKRKSTEDLRRLSLLTKQELISSTRHRQNSSPDNGWELAVVLHPMKTKAVSVTEESDGVFLGDSQEVLTGL